MDELVLPGTTVSIWYTPSVIHASLCLLQFFYRKSIFQQYTLSNRFISQQPPPPIQQVHLPAVSPSIHLRFTWYNPLAIFYLHMKRSRSLRWHSKSQVIFFFLNSSSLVIIHDYMDGQERVVHYLLFSHTLLRIDDHMTVMTTVYQIE